MIVWNARQYFSEDYNILISEDKNNNSLFPKTCYKKV